MSSDWMIMTVLLMLKHISIDWSFKTKAQFKDSFNFSKKKMAILMGRCHRPPQHSETLSSKKSSFVYQQLQEFINSMCVSMQPECICISQCGQNCTVVFTNYSIGYTKWADPSFNLRHIDQFGHRYMPFIVNKILSYHLKQLYERTVYWNIVFIKFFWHHFNLFT